MADAIAPPPVAALLLVLAGLLAGCTGPEAPGDGSASDPADGTRSVVARRGDGPNPPPMTLAMPEWAVGDAWTYEFNGAATTYVITSETATDWFMETDSAERSFSDLRDDISRLGPQRKSDLAGSQGDERVEYFRWPLTDGATWATTWDHIPVTVNSVVREGHADLTAVDAEGNLLYRYTYDADNRWFTTLTHYALDGSAIVSLNLTQVQRGWTGTVVRWSLAEVAANSGSGGETAAVPFEVPAGATDVWADYHFTCTGGAGYLVAVQPANAGLAASQGKTDSGPCSQVDQSGPFIEAPEAGTWAFTIDMGGQTAVFDYTVLVRTRLDVPFP